MQADAARRIDTSFGKAFAFLAALVFSAAYFYVHRDVTFRGDAFEIWEVSRNFYEPGRMRSFVEYRGPHVFMLYHELHRLARAISLDDVTVFRAFSAILFSLITTLVMPALAGAILGRRPHPLIGALFSIVTLYFFGGYFLHPQVDFLAFGLFGGSVALLLARPGGRAGHAVTALSGVLFLGAVLARFNYIVAAPAIAAWLVAFPHRPAAHWHMRLLAAALFLVPALAHLTVPPRHDSPQSPSSQERVLRMQLTVGLKVQKIEWNAGDPRVPGAVEISDPRGVRLLEAITPAGWPAERPYWLKPTTYVAAVIDHPGRFMAIWAEHLFNGMNLWYSSVYVQELVAGRRLRASLNFVLLIMGALAVSASFKRDRSLIGHRILLIAIVVLPALSAIPFVIEVRFFIPLLLLAHALAIQGAADGVPMLKKPAIFVLVAAMLTACIALSEHTWRSTGLEMLLQS